MIFSRNDIAIDLGTVNTIVRNQDEILFNEPTCIALDSRNRERIICLGSKAKQMIGRTPLEIEVINPLLNGAISDFETTKLFMHALIESAKTSSLSPRVGISIPQNLTQVERHSLHEATMFAGAKEVFLIEDPFSASVGAGIDISKAKARMVIDAGGGLVEVSIISLGGLVVSTFTKEAGDFIDYAIVDYCKYNKNIGISKEMAESIKRKINLFGESEIINVGAKNLINGMPIHFELNLNELKSVLISGLYKIKDSVLLAIDKSSPDMAADLIEEGAILTGGMALIDGTREFLEEELNMKITLSNDPLLDISKGASLIMQDYESYSLEWGGGID
ncbi:MULTISPECIES: rod shape-determining protein [Helicobacter]|uniref:Cell shape-determining protein MreB n=1 Tax=Helicobacter ibis TaxID=2962633 RepID=A0ABT4VCW0_9HELI|nr:MULTISPECIES: rod shape-determining protein [Helicobacter]MDA3966776.1 rod shape-determining protein [Helicobacter sp. WB40]MDA3968442.1 rod shape-determining protein [Helicobacter ibis]